MGAVDLDAEQLAVVELLAGGWLAPLAGPMGAADRAAVTASGRLADGTPFPVPVTLAPGGRWAPGDRLALHDREGVPVATLDVGEVEDGVVAGRLEPGAARSRYDLLDLRLTVGELRDRVGGQALVVPSTALLSAAGREALGRWAGLVVALVEVPDVLPEPAYAQVWTARKVAADLGIVLAAVPLGDAPDRDALRAVVARTIGATAVASEYAQAVGRTPFLLPDVPLPRPARAGVVVLLTGLSGSGKSTIANALVAALRDRDGRRVTLLDGDLVRRHLSSELGFSRAHRDLNIERIGFVAAEIAGHGGIAVCAPIAPYDATRKAVRAMVEAAGGRFVLVHVATPLAVCEQRDRKGLYAKARAGKIPEFTGISDPYEEPADADLRLDASVVRVPDAVDRILRLL